jgi:hypothetical protein
VSAAIRSIDGELTATPRIAGFCAAVFCDLAANFQHIHRRRESGQRRDTRNQFRVETI